MLETTTSRIKGTAGSKITPCKGKVRTSSEQAKVSRFQPIAAPSSHK